MKTVTAKEAKNRLGDVFRSALQAPVIVTMHGKPSVCIMSVDNIGNKNQHDSLDEIKHKLSCEVLASFSLSEIKKRSIENIERWRENGVDYLAYDDWTEIINDPDDQKMISAMIGLSQRSIQLRQSIPYVGMITR